MDLLSRTTLNGDCLEFNGYQTPTGYRQVSVNGKMRQAHRVSYEAHKGELKEGQVVRHACDNRACINPDHLMIGTQADNMDDMWSRDKPNRGNAKITEREVLEILNLKENNTKTAAKYGITPASVGLIRSGKTWRKTYEKWREGQGH